VLAGSLDPLSCQSIDVSVLRRSVEIRDRHRQLSGFGIKINGQLTMVGRKVDGLSVVNNSVKASRRRLTIISAFSQAGRQAAGGISCSEHRSEFVNHAVFVLLDSACDRRGVRTLARRTQARQGGGVTSPPEVGQKPAS